MTYDVTLHTCKNKPHVQAHGSDRSDGELTTEMNAEQNDRPWRGLQDVLDDAAPALGFTV